MDVTLHPAGREELSVVKNLVSFYIYDMSEHLGWACTPEGRFGGCDDLEAYWSEPNKHAFVLRFGDEPAGFALILADNAEPEVDFSVTDFFVLRKFRRRGVGERIARQLFDRFPGRWKVEQFAANTPAVAFWRTVVERYCSQRFEQRAGHLRGAPLNVLLFRSDEGRSTEC